jgi:TatA/E family protein of Tat protein translocase
MFGIGMPEMILILAIALIVMGPKKLPDLARSLGRAMREFRKATNELKETMQIDSDLTDVKKAFDGIQTDVREAVDLKPEPQREAAAKPETDTPLKDVPEFESDGLANLKNLKQAFDQLNTDTQSTGAPPTTAEEKDHPKRSADDA